MKIANWGAFFGTTQVKEKRDSDKDGGQSLAYTGNDGSGGSSREKRQDENAENPDTQSELKALVVTDEKVTLAMETFHKDPVTQANGLTAVMEGRGEATKIVLKDVSGNVIRQFTRQEFLKLSAHAKQDTHNRGKILDQKL